MRAILIVTFIIVFSSFCSAAEYPAYSGLSPEMKACLQSRLGAGLLKKIEKGITPKKNRRWLKADKIYAKCLLNEGEPIPEGLPYYDGLYFDAMSQIDETVNMQRAVRLVRESGVDWIALFARSRKRLGQNEREVRRLASANHDLIITGAPKYFRHKIDIEDDYIEATVKGIDKYGYRFVGEILYTHGDKKSGASYRSGERYTDPSLPGTEKLLTRLSGKDVPLMTHFEVYAPERDFHRFHKLYERWPDQIFIIPHMAFGSPGQVAEFLERHPNVYMTISKKVVLMDNFRDDRKLEKTGTAMMEGMVLKPEWKEILIRYQDRLLSATDAHMKKLWYEYPVLVFLNRVVLGQLPSEVAEKIAYKNARRIYRVEIN